MSYGGQPGPLGPEFQELARQKERERDADRAAAAVAAGAPKPTANAGFALDRLKRILRAGRDRTRGE